MVPHHFRVGTNPMGRSSTITGKILYRVGDGSSAKPSQAMVLPRKFFHKISTRVPEKYSFKRNLINTQSSPFKKIANLPYEGIILRLKPIIAFLVQNGFDEDLDTITIYKRIKTLDNLSEPYIQALLTFLHGCMTSRLVNDTGNFIPSIFFMDSTPPGARTWGLNKFNITFPTLFTHIKIHVLLQIHLQYHHILT